MHSVIGVNLAVIRLFINRNPTIEFKKTLIIYKLEFSVFNFNSEITFSHCQQFQIYMTDIDCHLSKSSSFLLKLLITFSCVALPIWAPQFY